MDLFPITQTINMNKNIDEMEPFELARWYSLIDAINVIADECEKRNVDFDNLTFSSLHLIKYVEKTCDVFTTKIIAERKQKQDFLNTKKKIGELVLI